MNDGTKDQQNLFGAEQASLSTGHAATGETIMINPALCQPWVGNARYAVGFCPIRSRELVDSIAREGKRVAAVLRPLEGGTGYEIISGMQRHGAVMHLVAEGSAIQLLARIVEVDDAEAWVISEAENAGRRDITPVQRARSWDWALHQFHEGRQDQLAAAIKRDEATVSRTLALLQVPPEVLAILDDPETMSVNFAARLTPHLNDPDLRAKLMSRAAELRAMDLRFPPPQALARLLLSDEELESFKPVDLDSTAEQVKMRLERKPNGSVVLQIKPSDGKIAKRDRRALYRSIQDALEKVFEGGKR